MKKRRIFYYNDMPFMQRKSNFMLSVLKMMMGTSRMDGGIWMGVYFSPISALRLGLSMLECAIRRFVSCGTIVYDMYS